MTMTKVKDRFFATRPWSSSCCAQPAFLGDLLIFHVLRDAGGFAVDWLLRALAVVEMVVAQAGLNVVDNLSDYRRRFDPADNTGARHSFVDQGLTHGGLFLLIGVLVAVDLAIAVYFPAAGGGGVLWLVILSGAFLLFFCTAPPASLKYQALGGTSSSSTSEASAAPSVRSACRRQALASRRALALSVLLFSVPVASMGDVILDANNTGDAGEDRKVKAVAFAGLMGEAGGGALEHSLVFGSFLVALVPAPILSTPLILVTLLPAPIACHLLYKLRHEDTVPREDHDRVDLDGASLNGVLCTLYGGSPAVGLTVL
ncbi:MAG: prenyltransferase [Actinomycetota bacterium]